MIKYRFAASALALMLGISTVNAADMTIKVSHINNSKGTIRAAVYDGAAGFPFKRKPLVAREVRSAKGSVTVRFAGLKAGTYAVGLFHDANGNKKLDKNLLGIPSEGYGFSNNARGTLTPPKFSAAAVKLGAKNRRINIKMGY